MLFVPVAVVGTDRLSSEMRCFPRPACRSLEEGVHAAIDEKPGPPAGIVQRYSIDTCVACRISEALRAACSPGACSMTRGARCWAEFTVPKS